jgi:hypothetical protein
VQPSLKIQGGKPYEKKIRPKIVPINTDSFWVGRLPQRLMPLAFFDQFNGHDLMAFTAGNGILVSPDHTDH